MAVVGQYFGPYQCVRRLGAGGMAETFLGCRRDSRRSFEQRVCIKVIRGGQERSPEFTRLFLREAALAGLLRHSNIVSILDLLADGSALIFELVEGADLRAILHRQPGRMLAPAEVCWVAMELCKAFDYAHRRTFHGRPHGIVHRDVSPSNVLVSYAGEIKLADFGIAKAMTAPDEGDSEVKGKAPYMSPEQLRGEPLDGRSDLFSLGTMMYELLAGQRPFDGASELETLQQLAAGQHEPLRVRAPHVPAALAEVVERLLQPQRALRFADASAVLLALVRCPLEPLAYRRLGQLAQRARPHETLCTDLSFSALDWEAPTAGTPEEAGPTLPLAEHQRSPDGTPMAEGALQTGERAGPPLSATAPRRAQHRGPMRAPRQAQESGESGESEWMRAGSWAAAGFPAPVAPEPASADAASVRVGPGATAAVPGSGAALPPIEGATRGQRRWLPLLAFIAGCALGGLAIGYALWAHSSAELSLVSEGHTVRQGDSMGSETNTAASGGNGARPSGSLVSAWSPVRSGSGALSGSEAPSTHPAGASSPSDDTGTSAGQEVRGAASSARDAGVTAGQVPGSADGFGVGHPLELPQPSEPVSEPRPLRPAATDRERSARFAEKTFSVAGRAAKLAPSSGKAPATGRVRVRHPVDAQRGQLLENDRHWGHVQVAVFPLGQVWLEGESVGRAPVNLRLSAGRHLISVGQELPTRSRSVVVVGGETQEVFFNLRASGSRHHP